MSGPRRYLIVLAGAGVLVVLGLGVVYFTFFSTAAPKRLALTSPPTVSAGGSAGAATSEPAGQLAGVWKVAPGSVVGFRVREQLASLPAQSDAVGRTSDVTGSVSLDMTSGPLIAKGAMFRANVASLKSDKARRDNYLRDHGLETDQFPDATFAQGSDLLVPDIAAKGEPANASVVGDLTIHGETRRVTIPLSVQLGGGQIQVVGSLTFPFDQFGMTPPSIGDFVTVTDKATLEFRLLLVRG